MNLLEEFASFAELMPEPMLLVRGDGEVVAANRRVAGLLGGTAVADIVGRTLVELTRTPADVIARWLRSCARSRALLPGSLDFSRKDGAWQICRAAAGLYRPASVDQAALILVRLAAREAAADPFIALNLRIEELSAQVRRRLRAEEALHAQREMLRVTLESIGDAVITTDEGARITFLNPVAEELTGWSQEEAYGRETAEIFVIVNEFSGEPVESPVVRVLREGAVVGLANHTVLIRKDGSRISIDDSGAPIRDEHGRLLGVVMVFHDITERRNLERELELRNQSLVEADQRKDEFLAMLAHELRNPLAPLRSGIHILRAAGGERRILVDVGEMMERQVQHLTCLVDDLLDVSRITRGRIELHRRPVALQGVLRHALEMVEQQLTERGHEVAVHLPEEKLVVDGDATRLAQVFSNLLSNAAKFTDRGGRVEVHLEEGEEIHTVRIRDNGIGIEAGMLEEVFELFTQADRSLDRSEGGLGLGLTVARQVVGMHGGSIIATSEGLGCGSEFSVVLPALPGQSPAADPAPRSQPEDPAGSMAHRVLVVDDNRDAADALAMLVGLWGHEVRVAHDGQAALAAAEAFRPHVVLLDLGLPGLDGFEVARRMRRNSALAGVRLIAVTGYGRDQDRDVSGEAGFDDHLTKPVDPEVVARLLGSRSSSG